MNVFYQLYCRTVHLGLKLVSPFLPYHAPRETNYRDLPSLLQKAGGSRVFVVTGKNVRAHGLCVPMLEALSQAGMGAEVYDDVPADPTVKCVERAYAFYRERGCDCVVAVGGGSPMDCAKGVCARAASPKKPLAKMRGALKVKGKPPLLVAVPTTAGSGSEATAAAVFTDGDAHDKFAVFSFKLVPEVCVLDPALTVSLPPAATAQTGLDALTHAVEAYVGKVIGRKGRAMAERAAGRIFVALPIAYADGQNMDARREMALAAFEAGQVFTVAYVGYVHALAHALGGAYALPHGLLCALLLPHVLRAYGRKAHGALARLAETYGLCGKETPRKEAAERFIAETEKLCRTLGIPEKLSFAEEDIPRLSAHAAREANPLYPVPKVLGKRDLAQILSKVRQ